MQIMTELIGGSCLCGLVSFEVSGPFDSFYFCHCSRCQKSSGSSHATNIFGKLDRIAWLSGQERIKKFELDYPILVDVDGTVGHQFNARRTPHMFVIDKKGILRYHGAIDNNAFGDKTLDEAMNYVVNAVRQISEGETVSPDYIKPYGCSVKYKN